MSTETDRQPCPMCGKDIPVNAKKCRFCGEMTTPKTAGDHGVSGLIPYKNPPALIAYYLGLFSLLPCFPIGLAALVLGGMGLQRVRANPEVRGTVHAWIGIILGGFFGLLWTICTLFAVIGAIGAAR